MHPLETSFQGVSGAAVFCIVLRTKSYDMGQNFGSLEVLHELEYDTDLFADLLKSMVPRLREARENNGGHTSY